MKKSCFRIPAVAAAALVVVGASPTRNADYVYQSIEVTPNRIPASVLVRNHNSLDVEIFAVTEAGRRFRLGSVQSGDGRTFDLPGDVCEGSAPFRLKVYSIGRKVGPSVLNHYLEAVKTQPLSPATGGEIVLQVVSPLSASFIDRGSQ